MESITIGQIIAAIIAITTISGFFIAILKWYKSTFSDRFIKIENRLDTIEKKTEEQENDIRDSKEERLILLNGLLACLKGLQEKGCNGPVTQGINDIEKYLIEKNHR